MEKTNTQVGGTHYSSMAVQPVDFIVPNKIPFAEGNVIEYVSRHRSKGKELDLVKAMQNIAFVLKYEYGVHCEVGFTDCKGEPIDHFGFDM